MYEEGFGIVIPATASNEIPLFQCRNRESTQKGVKGGKDILKKSGEKRSLAEICVVGKK